MHHKIFLSIVTQLHVEHMNSCIVRSEAAAVAFVPVLEEFRL